MNKLILVTGGARSGKSTFSESLTDAFRTKRFYIATAHIFDEEMRSRVELHQARRAGQGWTTLEEEYDLSAALAKAADQGAEAVLVDCLTVWINNLLFRDPDFSEGKMAETAEDLIVSLKKFPGTVILVLNEVGMGIVPENQLARTFRDCSGRCGQMIAAVADEVWLCVCGIPMKIKG